jgi:hypothetical protein
MAEFKKSDGTIGKCRRCNRKIVKGEMYQELHGALFGAHCVPYVERVEHLFSDPNQIIELVRTQHRQLTSAQTKEGWARRKAMLAERKVTAQDLLALGM